MLNSTKTAAMLVLTIILITCQSARAGTVEYDLSKFDAKDWEIDGAAQLKVQADGLHILIPQGGKRVTVRLKKYFEDEFDVKLRFKRLKNPPRSDMRVGFFLENPAEKASAETVTRLPPWGMRMCKSADN